MLGSVPDLGDSRKLKKKHTIKYVKGQVVIHAKRKIKPFKQTEND